MIWLLLFAAAVAALLLMEMLDQHGIDEWPSYARAWSRVFGEPVEQPCHVRAIGHDPCRFCHCQGFHDEGCGLLDRLDAGEAQP